MNKNLDELIDQLAEGNELKKHDDVSWGSLSDSEFQRKKNTVFSDLRLRSKQKRIAAEVSEIDRANDERQKNDGD